MMGVKNFLGVKMFWESKCSWSGRCSWSENLFYVLGVKIFSESRTLRSFGENEGQNIIAMNLFMLISSSRLFTTLLLKI